MIFTEKKITITNNQCKIDTPVVLYRGDYNVEVRFTLISSPYKYSNKQETNIIEQTEASFGQLVIKAPGDKAPIFSDISETKNGAVTFTITEEMIDEVAEVGNYTFQIRLLDENKESRATIPEIIAGIEIREPIAIEDVTNINEVGAATVGYALTTTAAETLTVFDETGNYVKTKWTTGNKITAEKLNKTEQAIYKNTSDIKQIEQQNHIHINKTTLDKITEDKINSWDNKIDSIPTEYVTETELNRKGYITEHQDISGKADKTELHNHSNKEILDSITQDKINQWNNGEGSEDNSIIPKLSTICVKDASGNYILILDFDLIPKDKSTVYLNDVFTEAQGDGTLKIRRNGIDNTLGTLTTDYMFVTVSYKTLYNKLFVANTRNAIEFDFNTNRRKNNNLSSLSGKLDKTNVLTLDNTIRYTPTQVYHPATKKYVDEQCNDIAKGLLLEDGKLYLKKSDGTKLGDGVILPVSGSGGSVAWESITAKPATFTPSSHKHSKSEITDFPAIPTKTSQLTNDSGYISSVPDEYITEAELNAKGYAPLDSPNFTNSISMARKSDTTIGAQSVALGYNTTASGESSHAEGYSTTASGEDSHAEGVGSIASGVASHAEGMGSTANGVGSHAEGDNTTANGVGSHAEGDRTIAASDHQHVQGKHNIEDTENKYAHIVGNGEADTARSNAHTLDWKGNAWYQGKISQDGTPTEDKDLTTKKYVDDKVAGIVDSGTSGSSTNNINDTTASTTTTYSSNKIETIKEGLNSQIEQKANQSDLEVERERINSFTTLSSGSTTGDAELIDGRIGADGVTYTNIGTAIRTQCGNLNNLLDIGYEVTSNNRIDDSKFVGQNFDTLIGHNGNESKTFTLGAKLKSKLVKGVIEFEDGTYADSNGGFFWFLKSSTGEASNVTLSTQGTLVIADEFDKYDQIGIGSWATYDKKIKTFFVGAYADDYDNYNEVLTSKVLDDIKISTPDNWYRDKKICAYGDSLVEQEKWQPYVASYLKCSFYNRGVGGTTVTQVNSSTNHMSGDMRINSIPTDSDVILIFAGHNDWSYAAINMGDLKTDALSESTSFKSAYALMIKKIQARCPNAKIITMTLVGGRTTSENVNEDKQFYIRDLCMTDFSKAIKEVSAYYGIPCIDVNSNCGINTLNHTTYIADLIHPNDAGGKLIANEVINGMKRFEPIDL